MSFFRWLKKIFTGEEPQLQKRFFGEGICPYCGQPLRTNQSRQCFACGADWHDPLNPVQRGTPQPADPMVAQLLRQAQQNTTPSRVPPVIQKTAVNTVSNDPSKKAASPQNVKLTGFDLDRFAPVSAAEAMEQAESMGRTTWLNPWFGRRDLIPPADDQRTLLIDRHMVAEGFTTPEELAEIHAIGAEMDRIRPDIVHAKLMADQFVAKSKEEHAEFVAKKKVEAEQRRLKRAEEIEHRRQTDIVFLGRGVSKGLADRRSNIELLNKNGMQVLSSPGDVAGAMGLSIAHLRWLAFHTETAERPHYVSFAIAKKNGKTRQLAAPLQSMRRAQQWILEHVLQKSDVHQCAHGFVSGRSCVTGAEKHVNCNLVVNADLKDFFPTINVFRVMGLFRSFGYSPAVATIFALLVTECPRQEIIFGGQKLHVATGPRGLPQGACTSPMISNLIARNLDRRFDALATKMGWTYTRYADDLTFSIASGGEDKLGYLTARIRHICQDEGFEVNESKTRVLRQSNRQTVTGIVVNDKPNVDRKTIRTIRAILHNAKKTGIEAQNKSNRPDFSRWLLGMIAYISMVNAEKGQQLRRTYDQLQQ